MSLAIKICGLTTPDTLAAALAGGASHVGLIFFARSPRNIGTAQAGELIAAARLNGLRAQVVAVTVDADDETLDTILAAVRPDLWQLHGSETPERVAEVKDRYQLPVMKALSLSARDDLERAQAYRGVADMMLFDAKPPKGSQLPGGNGVSFDWSILEAVPADLGYFLSGGLNAGNVGEALRAARPFGIDVSSGVERAPGVKDVGLIRDFFEAVARSA